MSESSSCGGSGTLLADVEVRADWISSGALTHKYIYDESLLGSDQREELLLNVCIDCERSKEPERSQEE